MMTNTAWVANPVYLPPPWYISHWNWDLSLALRCSHPRRPRIGNIESLFFRGTGGNWLIFFNWLFNLFRERLQIIVGKTLMKNNFIFYFLIKIYSSCLWLQNKFPPNTSADHKHCLPLLRSFAEGWVWRREILVLFLLTLSCLLFE